MNQISKYLRRTQTGYLHWCPGCNEIHHYWIDKPNESGAQWTFNGNPEKPTFRESMLIRVPAVDNDCNIIPDKWESVCHYFVTDGRIDFCGDSTHPLVGQSAPLPELPDHLLD